MAKLFSFFVLTSIIGCSIKNNVQVLETKDNPLIKALYLKDFEIRKLDAETDTVNLENYDKIHREQIFRLLAENKVLTNMDKIRAAWILQHTEAKFCEGELKSISPENFLLAYKLSSERYRNSKRKKIL